MHTTWLRAVGLAGWAIMLRDSPGQFSPGQALFYLEGKDGSLRHHGDDDRPLGAGTQIRAVRIERGYTNRFTVLGDVKQAAFDPVRDVVTASPIRSDAVQVTDRSWVTEVGYRFCLQINRLHVPRHLGREIGG